MLTDADWYILFRVCSGSVVNIKGHFWFVMNGERRGFADYRTFLELGFDKCTTATSDAKFINMLPVGRPFTHENITLHKEELRQYSFLPGYLNESINSFSSGSSGTGGGSSVREIMDGNRRVWSKYKGQLISYGEYMRVAYGGDS